MFAHCRCSETSGCNYRDNLEILHLNKETVISPAHTKSHMMISWMFKAKYNTFFVFRAHVLNQFLSLVQFELYGHTIMPQNANVLVISPESFS